MRVGPRVTQVNGDNDEVPGHLAYLLHMATRRLRAEAESAAAAAPSLQAAQARLLDVIPRDGGRLTDLALAMRISKQGLGQLATSLAHEGLVDVLPDPVDKRAKIIRRTARGDDVMRVMRSAIEDVEERCRAEVGNEQYETFLDVLRVFAGAARQS